MGALTALHDNVQEKERHGELPEHILVISELAARVVELGRCMGWQYACAVMMDFGKIAELGKGGEQCRDLDGSRKLSGIELRLYSAALAADVEEIRAAYSDSSKLNTKQAAHQLTSAALQRIAVRNPRVVAALRELRENPTRDFCENVDGKKLEAAKT